MKVANKASSFITANEIWQNRIVNHGSEKQCKAFLQVLELSGRHIISQLYERINILSENN